MTTDPPPWRTIRRREVIRERWLRLRADECETAEGATIAPYYVLEYPDWVQIVAIDRTDRLLMVRQYRHGHGGVSLEIPCGGMEPGDADPIAAGRRELWEETGHEADRWALVATLSPNAASHANRCHVLLAQGAYSAGRAADDPGERIVPCPMPVAHAVAAARSGAVVQAMHVAAMALALGSIGRW